MNISALIKLIRPQQWLKNGFVFAALFFAGRMFEWDSILKAAETFGLFCMLSSAIYIFNDIRDVEADKQHIKKKHRPLPSGQISLTTAWVLLLLLLGGLVGLFILMGANYKLGIIFAIYALVNFLYSIGLKHMPLVELFLVASGFVLRLIAGAVAIDAEISGWILICTGLVSFLLVVGKRRADIAQENDPSSRRKVLEKYTLQFLDSLIVVMAASTLVTYLLFCTSTYGQSRFGVFVNLTGVFVALGIFRFMQIVMVEQGGDSPTGLVARDKVMVVTILCWALTFFGLIYGIKV